jgi:tetratricopeptide (TPR) repeat protein/tRNA A-37 threonylcarbamoyl transferase component Bud32
VASPRSPDRGVLGYATTDIASTSRPPLAANSGEAPATWRPALEPDTVLADRYRIVTFLARGGMGEVYEAEDLTLKMRIALKSIAAEVAADARMIERLKREVLLARKVTHPNVCRLHDLGFHRDARGTIAFLTMDLLRGIPLAVHLARKGRLETAEALPILRQIAVGLDAAHDAGVIHRDLKARNVMLVEGDGPGGARATPASGGPRAVVMDFGIALAAEDDGLRALDTGEGRFLGTPAYMAPEQVNGTEISPATDVYALGVMLFEMVTGTFPFRAPTSLEVITMRLTHPAPPPRTRVPSLDERWDDAILKCLEREPGRRFARASEVVAAVTAPPRHWMRRRRTQLGALAALGALVAALGSAAAFRAFKPAAPESGAGKRRPTVAVLALQNESKAADAAWVSTALAGMLGTELAAEGELRVIPGDRVSRAEKDLSIIPGTLAPPVLAHLQENLAADYVISGGYQVAGEGKRFRIALALRDAHSGKELKTLTAEGDSADLYAAAASLGGSLRKKLGVRPASAEGIESRRAADYASAIRSFERTVAAEPRFALGHAALAGALGALGFDPRAQEEAKTAFELSAGLPRSDQLEVESRFRALTKNWDRAVEIDRALFAFFPDSSEYGLLCVRSLIAAGRSDDGLRVIETLRDLPPPDCDDPQIDIYEAVAASKISDFRRQLAAARAAEAKAEKRGQELILADAHHHVAEALAALGKPEEAAPERELARALYAKIGDRDGEAGELAGIGMAHLDSGDPAAALPLLERSLEIVRQVGARYKIANRVNEIGEARIALGDVAEARTRWEEARSLYEAIGDREGVGNTLGNLAVALTSQGDLEGAKQAHHDSIERLRAVKARSSLLSETLDLADLSLETGDRAAAERLQKDAETQNQAMDSEYHAAVTSLLRARMARESGDPATSKREAESALGGFEKEDAQAEADATKTLLAHLALADGRLGDAEALASGAAVHARAQALKSVEAAALAPLLAAKVRQKKLDEVGPILVRAAELTVEEATAKIDLDLAVAEGLRAVGGNRDRLAGVLDDARTLAAKGFFVHELEVRLAAARSMTPGARSKELQAIAGAAQAKGYVRLARAAQLAPKGSR